MRVLFLVVLALSLAVFTVLAFITIQPIAVMPMPESVVRGKRVWQEHGCVGCHAIFGNGAYVAPDLTNVSEVRDRAWLRRFLTDGPIMRPSTTKPHPTVSPAQVGDVLNFLEHLSSIDTAAWPPRPIIRPDEDVVSEENVPGVEAMPEGGGGD